MPHDPPSPLDRELLVRAEAALTQLNNQHGLDPQQSATLTAIRLRLEGKARATLEDLLDAGKDLGGPDALERALRKPKGGGRPRFEDVLAEADKRKKRDLGDLL